MSEGWYYAQGAKLGRTFDAKRIEKDILQRFRDNKYSRLARWFRAMANSSDCH